MSHTALEHVEQLASVIGPRGSATLKEKEAHEYVRRVLADLGCAARIESFQSSTSPYLPFILCLGLALIAEVTYWFTAGTSMAAVGALVAALISATTLISGLFELSLVGNPLRWVLPAARSQNVIGVSAPRGEVRNRVAVMAHADTHRTPLIWRTRRHFKVYRVLSALGVFGLAALTAMFAASLFLPGDPLRGATLVPAVLVGLAFLMVLQAHFTPFTAGASDDASGVGVMLSLAGCFAREPLEHSEVWWVASGCEEVGAYGSADFVRRHREEFRDGTMIIVDDVAGKDTSPVYLTSEGLLLPPKYPGELVRLAHQISAERPELGARAATVQGAYTDGAHALKAGLRCLAVSGFTRDNWIPEWHRPTDTFANVDADALDRTERFLMALLRKLDCTA